MRAPRAILALAAALPLAACADERPPGDAGPDVDADTTFDAAMIDAAPGTACGPTERCDPEIEICVVRGPVGPGYTYTCELIPTGCELDRSCDCVAPTYCLDAFDTCTADPPSNTITCECPNCQ